MAVLSDARILLVVGGGVAAYKALELVRRLRERGARTTVTLSPAALRFVTELSASSLSGSKTYVDLFSLIDEAEMGHIELSRSADLVVVAPATADFLAKMAHGLADDLASTLMLATDKPVLVAPAMNVRMWLHPATQRNVAQLARDGIQFVGPNEGAMACGEFGPGRMSEPLEIVSAIERSLEYGASRSASSSLRAPRGALSGSRVVVTSGPTIEPIDPIRFISNRSSGRQGHAIAAAAAAEGARVELISGPVQIADPPGVSTVHVETANEMLDAVEAALPADIFVSAAAVADWRVAQRSDDKLKKGGSGGASLSLVENPDILARVARRRNGRPGLVVGFAAETSDVLAAARAKLARKGCDLIIANEVGSQSETLGGLTNAVHLVSNAGIESWPRLQKEEVARRLALKFAELVRGVSS